ncbi:flagellar basal-body rod protein FlgF [Gammaproteobacteria bacterium 45_16_T64]|nr:flagellar basal-body rod protein FlgF [Gammaproteobacteria bacterium 45_16_T64]
MDKSIYIAMTGAREALTSMTVRANNLANASTTGFKSDYSQYRTLSVFGDGMPSRAYAVVERPGSDTTAGTFQTTGRDLDVALNGDGWLAIQTPDGKEAYTRAGDLKRSNDGIITTGTGLPVMGNGGPIFLPEYEQLVIGKDGTISIRGLGEDPLALTQVDRLKLVNPDKSTLQKGKDGLFHLKDPNAAALQADINVQVVNGVLEGSNVNPVAELADMISSSRLFEMNVKMMENAKSNDESSARIMQS